MIGATLSPIVAGLCGITLVIALWSSVGAADERPPTFELPLPSTQAPPDKRPGELVRELQSRPAPRLVSAHDVDGFIDWAAASTIEEADLVRKLIGDARENREVVEGLCARALKMQGEDHSRALIVLSLLGEMQSPLAEECLIKFVEQPLPEKGTLVDGEILERTGLAMLQAKAVDGLAFLGTERSNAMVLRAVRDHPARIVRAEAVAAYLWNQRDAAEAREVLKNYVRPDEAIFLDRITRERGDTAQSFNPKLDVFLKAHPKAMPPAPAERPTERMPTFKPPPKF
ncbi:MAG TPA: hypothetical protein VLK82_10280 [Candidatus Tectomicrobia bacterium]|nr:hypothetical protein [Candidatus Tectomicrobia bacterium]